MKPVLCLFLILFGSWSLSAAETSESSFDLAIGFCPAFPSGPMKDLITNSLTPKPDDIQAITGFVHAAYFPFSWVGVESYLHWGATRATAKSQTPLDVLDTVTFLLGPVGRYSYPLNARDQIDFDLSGGLQASSVTWDKAYSDLTPSGKQLATIQPGMSWYGRLGLSYKSEHVFFGLSALLLDLPARLSNGNSFNATEWGIPIEIGWSF